jgi:hypothetical protein
MIHIYEEMIMDKQLLTIGVFLVLIIAGFCGCTEDSGEDGNNGVHPPGPNNGGDASSIEITKTGSSYKTVDSPPTSGWFTNGQEADIVLNWFDFDDSGGPLCFYHPMGITNDGQHLLLADTCNNRVLIWNSLPTGNVAPDLVLGQDDFNTNTPGTAQGKLRWPVDVSTDGEKVVVADAYNDRVLIWNNFPIENGQPADLVLGQVDFETVESTVDPNSIGWPWAVWTNGEKLIVTSTAGGSVMIWNSFPTVNDQQPDLILTNSDFGTPRNIESDGETYLVIGDHNARNTGRGGNFIWNNFPTVNVDYDTYLNGEVIWCSEVIGNDLYGTPGSQVAIISDFLELEGDYDLTEMEDDGLMEIFQSISFESGDGSGMTYAKVGSTEVCYFSLYNGGRVAGYLGKPEDREPDFVIGSDSNTNPLVEEYYFMDNPSPIRYNDSLIVVCGFTHRIEVWKNIPDESGATPDIVFTVNFEPLSGAVYDDKFYVIGRGGFTNGGFLVWDWDDLLNGGEPEVILSQQLGSIDISEGNGITFDETYAYITSNGKLYIWEQPFDWNESPLKEVTFAYDIGKISSNGEKLAAQYVGPTNTIILVDVDSLEDDTPEFVELLSEQSGVHFNLPQGVFIDDNYLFVADTSYHRVLIWNEMPSSGSDQPDVVIGQSSFESGLKPKFTRDGLFMPSGVWFDGSYLWVGELKFSHRVLIDGSYLWVGELKFSHRVLRYSIK